MSNRCRINVVSMPNRPKVRSGGSVPNKPLTNFDNVLVRHFVCVCVVSGVSG